MRSPLLKICFFTLVLTTFTLWLVYPAYADTITVTTNVDEQDNSCSDGDCSLRDAINLAVAGDTITFAGDYTIYLDSTLTISKQLTIDGSDHTITVSGDSGHDGDNDVQVFSIGSSGVATLTHLSVVNGATPTGGYVCPDNCGGGVYIAGGGKLTVINSTFSGNTADIGGGIRNEGALTVQNSTFSDNDATAAGGGIDNIGTLNVTNSTFSGNNANFGGGIRNYNGALAVLNSTFSGNIANMGGGGIRNWSTLSLTNTLIANNPGGDCSNSGSIGAKDHNLIKATGANACGLTNGVNGNIIGVNPLLASLDDYGSVAGQTLQTFALLPGSPAIDAGNNAVCAASPVDNLDQRGIVRPVGTACDIGAFESQGFDLTYGSGSNQSTLIDTVFTNPLTLSVSSSFTEPVDGGQVFFTGPSSGAGINPSVYTAVIETDAVTQVVMANNIAGSYTVAATTRGNLDSPVSFNLTNLPPTVTLALTGSPLAEASGVATVTATLSVVSGQNVTVTLNYSGEATYGSDYTSSGMNLVIPAGSLTGTIILTAAQDTMEEPDETIIVDIESVANGVESGEQQVIATITDDDLPPTVTLTLTGSPLAEASGVATVTATLSAISSQDVTVTLSYSGTATNGSDYTHSGTSLVLPAGSLTGTVILTAIQDILDEPDETIIVEIDSVANGSEDGEQIVIATIADDDLPPTVTINDVLVYEDEVTATFTVSLSTISGQDVSLDYATANGAATAGSDYTALPTTTLTIPAGSLTGTIAVTIIDDQVDEIDETFVVNLTNPLNVTISNTQGQGKIIDNDTVGIDVSPLSLIVSEPNTTGVFTISLNSQPTDAVTVTLTSTDTTECSVPAQVILDETTWQTGVGVTVTAVDDQVFDGSQSCAIITTAGSNDPDYNNRTIDDVSVAVTDNETRNVIVANATTAAEGGPAATYTIQLAAIPTDTVTITFTTGTEVQGIADLTFNPNITALDPQTVTVVAVNDIAVEGDHNQVISHSASGGGYDEVSIDPVAIVIMDNDIRYTLAAPADVVEGHTGAQSIAFTITRTGDISRSSTIDLTLTGDAAIGLDYSLTGVSGTGVSFISPTITFAANAAQANVDLDILGDYIEEDNKVITVTLTNPTGSGVGGTGFITGSPADATIIDDDNADVQVSPTTPITISEPSGQDTFIIRLTSQPTDAVTFDLTVSGDECSVDTDPVSLDTTTWQDGVTVTVTAVNDQMLDGSQSCLITTEPAVSNDSNYAGRNPADITVTVTDDESLSIQVSPTTGLTTTETGGVATFTVRLGSPPTTNVTVTLTSSDTTEGTVSPAALVFTPANWSTNQIATVTGVNDLIADGDIAYTIQTGVDSNDNDYSSLDPDEVALTNLDDDLTKAGYTLTPNNFSLVEGSSQVVSVTLGTQPTDVVTITLSSSDPTKCSVSPTSITLNTNNWKSGVSFTVGGVNGSLNSGDQSCAIITTVSTADSVYGSLDPADITLTVITQRRIIYLPLIVNGSVDGPDLVVDSITTGGSGPSVVIRNAGTTSTPNDFWVDVYFDPNPAPPPVNQTWQSIAPYGAHWGVTDPLAPGETLTLTIGGSYYVNGSSAFPSEAQVYAYVDSVNYATNYGNVQENNETNNVFGPVVSTAGEPASGANATVSEAAPSTEGLPER